MRDRKAAYLGEATYIPVLSQSSKPSIQPHGKGRGWATWISSSSYLNCSSSLHNLLGRGVIFLTLQTGKERDPRFDGFIKTTWTVTENLSWTTCFIHNYLLIPLEMESFFHLGTLQGLWYNCIGKSPMQTVKVDSIRIVMILEKITSKKQCMP